MLLENTYNKKISEAVYNQKLWVNPGVKLSVPNVFLEVLFRYQDLIKGLDDIGIFVETGTEGGDTANIMSKHFNKIYTIEIIPHTNPTIFEAMDDPENKHVVWLQGDSVEILKQLNETIGDQRCVFLLDAHTANSSCLEGELKVIKKYYNKQSVIIVDDGKDINVIKGYPTLVEFKRLIYDINSEYKILNTDLGRRIYLIY